MYRIVTVKPSIRGGMIRAKPEISKNASVTAVLYTPVRSYSGGSSFYEGPYDVTPKAYEQTILETKGLCMKDNVVILEVPYFETSNLQNGYTVYIGSEV